MIKIETVDNVIWDRISVIKITKYPFEQKAFKPFAQARLCYKRGNGLIVKMLAFEVAPPLRICVNGDLEIYKDSVLSVVLGENNRSNLTGIAITFNKNGNYIIQKIVDEKKEILQEKIKIDSFSGEDLQGIYWGGCFIIPNNLLKKYLNIDLDKENILNLNFIKSCSNKQYFHCGGFIPVKGSWVNNLYEFILS